MRTIIRVGACAAALGASVALAEDDYRSTRQTYTSTETVTVKRESKQASTGLYALIGGGMEGYTGKLAPELQPGASYGAVVGYRPVPMLGLELGYSGGLSDIDTRGRTHGGITDGPDIVRNGGQAALVADLTDTRLQPYVLGGIGFEHFNIRNDVQGAQLGFKDDTSAYAPVGVGLRYQMGKVFTADARVNYDFLLGQDFAPTPGNDAGSGRYQATLSLGGTY
ncbi:hypothetical protein DRW03_34255 [Corallococcus sp. H22C18031201]|uniref:outer membrane protein n=1 Tax=Citreicoccus inhibens TaxID=2849499 RepID=UPI000E718AB1|nr:outer membrane beta-barrel protein [Citreicoccus inhibens]MBU8896681.1 outer membrane beta-barrel protein [Citreicoccus inhibens]RJS14777.1 hypothetical protein DRW03_34255 [Corallococcus sp. H22C18031201]